MEAVPAREHSAYRPSGSGRVPAVIGAALSVCGMLAAFLFMNVAPAKQAGKRHDLVTVTLSITPPPASRQPPAPKPQDRPRAAPRANQPPIVAPKPIVALPAAPSPVAAAAVPSPQPVAAPPAPAAAPAPAVAATAASQPVGGGDLSSNLISARPPAYPLESRHRHEQGTVVLSLTLAADGRVQDIAVARSSGYERLDEAALSAVRKWRWAPLVRDGAAVMVRGQVSIPFVLKG